MGHQPPPDVVAAAQVAELKWKIPASVTLAQWALESGWGEHMPPGSNNPFGIKARPGQPSVSVATREYLHGQWVTQTAQFRAFPSIAIAFDAHAQLLATAGAYAKARMYDGEPDAFARGLQGVYATDPNYASLLHAVMTGSDLYQYDASKLQTA